MINANKYLDMLIACVHFGADMDGKVTKTKLAKLMYLADFSFFFDHGKSITDANYLKLPQGPVPVEYFSSLHFLSGMEKISTETKGKSELICLKNRFSVDDLCLEKNELMQIKNVCKKWKTANTKEIVNFTHAQLPWSISFEGQTIPYSLIIQEENVY